MPSYRHLSLPQTRLATGQLCLALYAAFAADTPLTTALILAELRRTRPLSQTMPERVAALRDWAQPRVVMAE
ncbi:MAG TPA: hypothetical protein VFK13_07440 [Gemmatimonadaceae bacterium]|nr:hypothetical protein [Gemmatimonadaceae bacterium]